MAFFKFFRSKKKPFKGEGRKQGGKKRQDETAKRKETSKVGDFVSSSSMSMVSHIYNIFEILKNGWSGKQILNFD